MRGGVGGGRMVIQRQPHSAKTNDSTLQLSTSILVYKPVGLDCSCAGNNIDNNNIPTLNLSVYYTSDFASLRAVRLLAGINWPVYQFSETSIQVFANLELVYFVNCWCRSLHRTSMLTS